MAFRYFCTLCVISLFIAVFQVSANDELDDNLKKRAANPAFKAVTDYIATFFQDASQSCLREAAQNCIQYWKQPTEAVTCAKKFLKDNQGRCLFG